MNTLQNLWHKLTAPRSTGVDEARREYMTKVIFVILILVNTVLFVPFLTGTIVGVLPSVNIGVNFLIELFLIAGWWWVDRGYWRVASYAIPLTFFLLALWINFNDGVGSAAMLLYALMVLLAAMLQGGMWQWVILAICITAYLGIGWMHTQGLLPPVLAPEQNFIFFAVAVSGNLLFTAVLQWFYTSQFRRTMAELVEHKATLEQRVEERTTELQQGLEEREQLQQQVIEAQRQAIQELSMPVIPVMDRIIVMPLIGSIDSIRARDITRSLLAGINQHRAKVVILDVTGVRIMDTGIVNHLNKTIQAARLKGARVIVTGISDAVAETIVDLGIDWSRIESLRDLQTGLIVALKSLGVQLSKSPKTITEFDRQKPQ